MSEHQLQQPSEKLTVDLDSRLEWWRIIEHDGDFRAARHN